MIQRELTILWPTEGWRIAEVLARQDVINPLRQLYESLTRFTTLSASMRELPDLVFRSAAPPTTVSELIELLPVSSSAFYEHWHEEVSGTATPKELLDWVLLVRATWMVRRHRSNTFPPPRQEFENASSGFKTPAGSFLGMVRQAPGEGRGGAAGLDASVGPREET